MRKALFAALLMSVLSTAAGARQVEDDSAPPDARTEGYAQAGATGPAAPLLIAPASGYAGTWALTLLLGAVCIGVMFKNGKRSHLD